MAFYVVTSDDIEEPPDDAPFDVTILGGSFDAMTPTIERDPEAET